MQSVGVWKVVAGLVLALFAIGCVAAEGAVVEQPKASVAAVGASEARDSTPAIAAGAQSLGDQAAASERDAGPAVVEGSAGGGSPTAAQTAGGLGPEAQPAAPGPQAEAPPVLSPEALERDQQLRGRVRERWEAMIARDLGKAYEYESPEYRRLYSAKDYAGQFGSLVTWLVATVKDVRYHRDTEAEVVVALGISFPLDGDERKVQTTVDIAEQWVFQDGQWWRHEPARPLGSSGHRGPETTE